SQFMERSRRETLSPADETPSPGDETLCPRDETPSPGDETLCPRDETPSPGDETPSPGDETLRPGQKTLSPRQGERQESRRAARYLFLVSCRLPDFLAYFSDAKDAKDAKRERCTYLFLLSWRPWRPWRRFFMRNPGKRGNQEIRSERGALFPGFLFSWVPQKNTNALAGDALRRRRAPHPRARLRAARRARGGSLS